MEELVVAAEAEPEPLRAVRGKLACSVHYYIGNAEGGGELVFAGSTVCTPQSPSYAQLRLCIWSTVSFL